MGSRRLGKEASPICTFTLVAIFCLLDALLESQWAWIEQFVYMMCNMKKDIADVELGGLTAAAKAHGGIVLKECADTAALLFGGNGYTRSGQGEIAERMWREVNGNRIPGESPC